MTVKRDTGRTLLATQLGLPGRDTPDDDADDSRTPAQRVAARTPENIQALFANLVDAPANPASRVVQAQYVQAPVQATQPMVVQGGQPMMVQGAEPMVMPQAQPQVMLPPGAVPQGPLPAGVVPYDPNNPMMAGTPWKHLSAGRRSGVRRRRESLRRHAMSDVRNAAMPALRSALPGPLPTLYAIDSSLPARAAAVLRLG